MWHRAITVGVLVAFAGLVTAAPVPKALKKKPLRAKIEPLPGERLFTADFKDVPTANVFEWLEKETGLMYITKDKPDLKITLHAEKVCLPELFAQLDDLLYPQGWYLVRWEVSFSTLAVEKLAVEKLAKMDRKSIPLVLIDDLERRSQYESVQVIVNVGEGGADAAKPLATAMNGDHFWATSFGTDQMLVTGRVTDVRKFVDDMGSHIKK
jgi:hypothetical protein